MKLTTIAPSPEIAPWIHHFWIFESPIGLPSDDLRVVVPNGRHKLIVPWRNALTASSPAATQTHGAGDAVLIGLWEQPTTLVSEPRETVTIGVEFLPHGLTRFFPAAAREFTERIVPVTDALGRVGRALLDRVMNEPSPSAAAQVIDRFLVDRFRASAAHAPLVDAALSLLHESGYTMQINELEARMGYSRRYLHALFVDQVGLAPKKLSSVMLFERLYRQFSQDKSASALRDDAVALYADQSHFIRHFKRFTGFSPTAFAELDNEFGRIFYRAPSDSSQTSNTRVR